MQLFANTTTTGCRGYRKHRLAAGGLALVGSLIGATAISAGATANKAVSASASSLASTVRPDLGYYKGKAINIIYWGSPGGVGDIAARTLAPYIGAYLHASVTVTDISGGGTIPGQNAGADATPNGLTIGMLNVAGDVGNFIHNTPGLNFNLRSIPLLPSLVAASTVMVNTPAAVKAGLNSLTSMVRSKTPISVLAESNSTVGVEMQLLYGAYKIPAHFIYGYSSGAATLAGFARGDGQTTMQGFAVFQPDIVGGVAVPIFQSTAAVQGVNGYAIMRKVPVLSQYVAANPPKTNNAKAELQVLQSFLNLGPLFSSQVGTPAKYQAALAAAINFAASRGGVKAALIKNGDNVGVVQPSVLKKEIGGLISQQGNLSTWLQGNAPPAS